MKPLLPATLIRRMVTRARRVERQQEASAGKMSAWQIHGYGDVSELMLTAARVPHINAPNELLVKVDAASVNPIDVAMIKGYGSTAFNFLRGSGVEFPLTLGRDFSGTVEWKGPSVTSLKIGDRVWGVLPPHKQGCHAEYAVVKQSWVAPQPTNLSNEEAAGILYAGLTAWSALWVTGALALVGARGRRVLVLGAAGGVGSLAVQMLRAADAHVVCSCSSDATSLVETLGADIILDRKHPEYEKGLVEYGPYDIIFDCAGLGPSEATRHGWKYRTYITLTTPLLRDMDQGGLLQGAVGSGFKLMCANARTLMSGSSVLWAYFIPSATGIKHIQNLVESNKLRPIIGEVFGWADLPKAFERVKQGHMRGKAVVSFDKEHADKSM